MPEPEHEMIAVMPYICCKSNGGVYDDASFVAGARMSSLIQKLEAGPEVLIFFDNPHMVDQYDLIAMRFGYSLTVKATEGSPAEHTLLEFNKLENYDVHENRTS